MPAFDTELDRFTVEADNRSWEASTILRAGATVPVEVTDRGLEINALNFNPLGTCAVLDGELPPHEMRLVHPITSKTIPPKIFFNPGTQQGMCNSELDAKKRIIAEAISRPPAVGRILPPDLPIISAGSNARYCYSLKNREKREKKRLNK